MSNWSRVQMKGSSTSWLTAISFILLSVLFEWGPLFSGLLVERQYRDSSVGLSHRQPDVRRSEGG